MKILDFLFPPSCPVCMDLVSQHGLLCASCWGKFNWIADPKCFCCGYPFPSDLDLGKTPLCPVCASGNNELDWMRSACVYDDFSRSIMLPFKHAGALKYKNIMVRSMISALAELEKDIDVVIPVPLAYRRLYKRGFNQATLLARPIAKHIDAKLDTTSVKRKFRPDMGYMGSKQRAENIKGVFSVKNPENIRGKTILLVDDVVTTGATFKELKKVLKKAGAKSVCGIVFCRTVRVI